MDVGGWLRKLGLEQYEPAFRENKIDSKILPKLTAEDLRDLGVTLVGDRRRLLDAIASLRDEAVSAIEARAPLEVRIGIATGLAVVGDLIGEGAAQERGVVGETPNLAARLQALARPGAIVIAEGTRRQIGGLFELDDLGLQSIAGFDVPQRAWRIVGDSGV